MLTMESSIQQQVEHLRRPVRHRRHVRGSMVPVAQRREPGVSTYLPTYLVHQIPSSPL